MFWTLCFCFSVPWTEINSLQLLILYDIFFFFQLKWHTSQEESAPSPFLRYLRLFWHAWYRRLPDTDSVTWLSSSFKLPWKPKRRETILWHLWGVWPLDKQLQWWWDLLTSQVFSYWYLPTSPAFLFIGWTRTELFKESNLHFHHSTI